MQTADLSQSDIKHAVEIADNLHLSSAYSPSSRWDFFLPPLSLVERSCVNYTSTSVFLSLLENSSVIKPAKLFKKCFRFILWNVLYNDLYNMHEGRERPVSRVAVDCFVHVLSFQRENVPGWVGEQRENREMITQIIQLITSFLHMQWKNC